MATTTKQHIFFVDDEPKICKAVTQILKRLECEVSCFDRGSRCLKKLQTHNCDLLITDVKMPDMDGIELLKKVRRIVPGLPILVITGYADIPLAVRAIKAGAVDFVEKPLHRKSFLAVVQATLKQNDSADSIVGKLLSPKEKVILNMLLQGKCNKEIAFILSRSVRTIEDHRSHIMRKFNVDNIVDLTKRAVEIGLINPSAHQ
jgi:two-component system response regulator FixJ